MRYALPLILFATACPAWEFTPGLPCLLNHEEGGAAVALTYDPTAPLYTISITTAEPWPVAPNFSMRFDGPSGLMISTDRQTFSADRRTLTVTDRGFGNVLNGLQFNESATATLGAATVRFSLSDAAEPVSDFRQCRASPGV
ncbi:hypothetical protein CEP88_16220 [Roseobacter denitrificans]|uniref:Lipoprotein n=1 Tax=Roseobacter denitrificans (strain ATCC 33942 / OCh 114) TaxID=375451 RepID=Q16AU6_ROSDO|nr:hypothetical protein [Roseobacter denitrificans]ABG30897.1 hypothetical protein RD1_1250 [Roseobacter denitrificans OCh 114]AVL53992.1 hypothetical protein CEP88_16220 [Roseobacter denitrificans]SFG14533.1 hypothetical protein SAMN05443635_108142 [Roseobacter denitrificans OCh 114]